MKIPQSLRVHNAMVIDRMRGDFNQLRASKRLGYKTDLAVHHDRNALAFHYIESGAIKRFSVSHRIKLKRDEFHGPARRRPGVEVAHP